MSTHKLLVIGLDGGNFDAINPLIAQGRLPNLARIQAQGSTGGLRSVIPPRSAPAWITFMTGWNPGRHGALDFWERDWRSYSSPKVKLITSDRFAGRTFWDYASASGRRIGIVTVPVTYPAWPVNGFLLSSYLLSPGQNDHSSYPPALDQRFGNQLRFPDAYREGSTHEAAMREGPRMIRYRGQVAACLQKEHNCDLLVVVLGPVDKAQHDFWRYREPDCPPDLRERYGDVINHHYEVCDAVIGDLWQQMGIEETNVVIVSDHGAGPYPRRCFQTHYVLREHGLLATLGGETGESQNWLRRLRFRIRGDLFYQLKTWGRRLLPKRAWDALYSHYQGIAALDWSKTACYRVRLQTPVEGIMINVKGRQPQGIVEQGEEYESVRENVMDIMRQAVDPETDQHVVEACYRREELFSGSFAEEMPDIFLLLRQGYKGDKRLDVGPVSPTPQAELERFRGEHTMDGIFIAAGPSIQSHTTVQDANLIDIAPTLLCSLGLPIPEDMEGKVLEQVFRQEWLALNPPRRTSEILPGYDAQQRLTEEDEKEITDRLAGLGYVE